MNKFVLLSVAFFSSAAFAGETRALSLRDALRTAEASSPQLKASSSREQAVAQGVDLAKSRYLPQLSANFIASTGNPGSFSLLDVDSNFSSADRVGAGGALVVKQDIYDFGRTASAVAAARAERDYESQRTALERAQVDEQVLLTYLDCAYLKEQMENSRFVSEQAELLAKETGTYVRSGQRSVVERYLVDAQVQEAKTRIEEFNERTKIVQNRLAIQLGLGKTDSVQCSSLSHLDSELSELEKANGVNAFLEAQRARIQMMQSRLDLAKAEARPTLVAAVTGGYFDTERVPSKMNYSAGVGITIPIFTGFRVDAGIEQAAANLSAENSGFLQAQLELDQANSRYDEQIRAVGVRLASLRSEEKLARKVFDLAHKRYQSLQGNMVDLREAIRNLTRVLESTDQATRELLVARGRKSLLNGLEVSR